MSNNTESGIEQTDRLHLFDAFGVELEYMIVDSNTLDVKPITDKLFYEISGSYVNEIERGEIAWSNELTLHVIELKTNGPAKNLAGLHLAFQHQVNAINKLLEPCDAQLMPGAMHPWMEPDTEMKLWPHEYNPIYEAYNRIFDCRGHGWANLQSTHINMPFANDLEFGKLHAAIRVLLPILPGLAASSPIADLKRQPRLDYRLEVYRNNSKKIPSVTGLVVPEQVFNEQEYNEQIFKQMYRDISPYDPENILQDEWLNSRGAIARFDRGSIEIRVLDIQECPLADLAIVRIVIDTVKALTDGKWSSLEDQKSWNERNLFNIFIDVVDRAENTFINNKYYLSLFGLESSKGAEVSTLWRHLFEEIYPSGVVAKDEVLQCLDRMISHGTLSSRISKLLPYKFTKKEAVNLYKELCNCLKKGELFGTDG